MSTHPPQPDDPPAAADASASPPDESGTTNATLLVAHGSRNPASQRHHEALCDAVGDAVVARGGPATRVAPAYLELAEPSIPDAIDAAVAGGARNVRLVPHFLGPGNHVAVDLPEIVDAARERHPNVELELAEFLGADPGLVQLLASRVAP